MLESTTLEYEQLKDELKKATALLVEVPEFPGSVTSYWIYRRDELLARDQTQPAAPTPECSYVGRCNSSRCPVHGEPAPEPSADFPSTIRKGKEWQERAESAEAQLAAVREQVRRALATVTAEKDANSELFERALDGYETERAAHEQTRQALAAAEAKLSAWSTW